MLGFLIGGAAGIACIVAIWIAWGWIWGVVAIAALALSFSRFMEGKPGAYMLVSIIVYIAGLITAYLIWGWWGLGLILAGSIIGSVLVFERALELM